MSEARLLSAVSELSSLFTTNRSELNGYGLSSEQVSAYAYFYFPTNLPALGYVLDRLPINLREKLRSTDFMDWGTGPGTYLVAWARYFALEKSVELFGIDQSPLMLKQARQIWEHFGGQELNIGWHDPKKILNCKKTETVRNEKKLTLCFGNSMNEMGAQRTLQVIKHFGPEHIIFLEPGTPSVFQEMLVIRKEMAELGWNNVFPCPESKHVCPMQNMIGDWCHQIMLTTHDPSIERLSQKLHLDRRTRPLLAHVYSRAHDPTATASVRVVRSFPPTKASYRFLACRMGVSFLENIEIEFLMRDTDPQMRKKLDKLRSGDILNFEIKQQITPNKLRAKGLV